MKKVEKEFEILEKFEKDSLILPFKNEIISLVNKFHESGQSGGSAPYTAHAICDAIKKLFLYETISPLTGEDSEWNDVSDLFDTYCYQNNRNGAVFKDKDGEYFLDAIIWQGEDDYDTFTGQVNISKKDKTKINSNCYINSFPFTPKRFYIDVLTIDDERYIKDINQLKEVYRYYKCDNPKLIRDLKLKRILKNG